MKTEQRINPKFLVKLKDIERHEEAIDAVEDTNFTENEKARLSKSQGNDDRFLQHQRRNIDSVGT
jgi:hypothetical protein